MNTALTTLLSESIDYAGTFPPACLPLEHAATNYLQYRSSADSWLLGRFVCTAAQLAELPAEFAAGIERRGQMSVLVGDAQSIEQAGKSKLAPSIGSLEMRRGDDAATLGDDVERVFRAAADVGLSQTIFYFEIPTDAEPQRFAAALAGCNRRRSGTFGCRAGLKVRTGGTTAAAVPSTMQLAEVAVACRDHGLFWKATAGLHQPFRHFDPALGVHLHGFINLFVAATLADVQGLATQEVATILDDDDAKHFSFTPLGLSWRGNAADLEQIASARRRGLQSFGSCSFSEPLEGLKSLS